MSTGNVWARNDRKGRDKGTNEVQGTPKPRDTEKAMEILSKGYASVAAEDPKTLRYKSSGPAPGAKAGAAPWASKPNNMANGKDFFTELRKQVSALQQANERAGG